MIEYKIPDLTKYMAICYDDKETKSRYKDIVKKHYRRFLDVPLEESNYMDKVKI